MGGSSPAFSRSQKLGVFRGGVNGTLMGPSLYEVSTISLWISIIGAIHLQGWARAGLVQGAECVKGHMSVTTDAVNFNHL